MPKLSPETQLARREHILDAAELCFAGAGFHGTSMQDICRGAGVSPGALYGYFSSKEELIAGIADRDRSKIALQLSQIASAPDLVQALAKLGEYYTIEEPRHKRVLCLEIGAEATRNEKVGHIFRSVDGFVRESFEELFKRASQEGRIAPELDARTLSEVLCLIGDGLFWRRAVDPEFDANTLMPAITSIVAALLRPLPADPDPDTTAADGQRNRS